MTTYLTAQKRLRAIAGSLWGRRLFDDRRERALRLLEEAAEYAQAVGAPPRMIFDTVQRVRQRPAGDPRQELAGVALCLLAACEVEGLDHLELAGRELAKLEDPENEAKLVHKNLDKGLAGTSFYQRPPLPCHCDHENTTQVSEDDHVCRDCGEVLT